MQCKWCLREHYENIADISAIAIVCNQSSCAPVNKTG